jgi:outer membrane protein OmpA-like peptidoglycan-associated protein
MFHITTKTNRINRLMLACVLTSAVSLAGCLIPPSKHDLTREQISVLKQQGFAETDDGWTLDQSAKVLFAIDDATLTATSERNVVNLAKMLRAVNITHLKVVGYTDSWGKEVYNDELSIRRAKAVVVALVNGGIQRAGVEPTGMGKRHPIADNKSEEGRAQNRRVAIIVVID